MIDAEDRRTEIIVEVPHRPGMLAQMGEILGEAGVNIIAAAALSHGAKGIIHLVVDDASSALLALKRSEVTVTESREVLVVSLEDRPGALGRFARQLADRDINISALYTAGERLGDKQVIVALEPHSSAPEA